MMEPMALGSAPSSPSSPTANPNYLPPFLIGDVQSPTSNNQTFRDICTNDSYNLTPSNTTNLRQKLFSPGFVEPIQTPIQSPYDSNENRPGPPRQSLFDTIDLKRTVDSTAAASATHHMGQSQDHNSFFEEFIQDESFFNVNDPVRGITRNQWVTVYGFPNSVASVILAQFANYGTIIDKRFPTQGNWVHLKYNSPIEASKALALNGKLITNNIMIGVCLYQNEQDKNVSSYKSPARVRSLRQSFVSPQNSNTVLTPESVPQKSTGLVTKAIEYVFGW